VIASWIVPRPAAKAAPTSGSTGTRICMARVPEAVTATISQNGAGPRRDLTGVVSQPRRSAIVSAIRCRLAAVAGTAPKRARSTLRKARQVAERHRERHRLRAVGSAGNEFAGMQQAVCQGRGRASCSNRPILDRES
jgi:hypothetical protein